jgi:hypothetical protein
MEFISLQNQAPTALVDNPVFSMECIGRNNFADALYVARMV